jgi:hypothetical protein
MNGYQQSLRFRSPNSRDFGVNYSHRNLVSTGLMIGAINHFKIMIFSRKVLFLRVEINE